MMAATAAVFTAPAVAMQIGIAMAHTTVTVTMLEDRLVCSAAQSANSNTSATGASVEVSGVINSVRNAVIPISGLVMAAPKESVAAHIIRLPHGIPLDMASTKFIPLSVHFA